MGISIVVLDGCYEKIALILGLAMKTFINGSSSVINASYRGEIGVVLFNHSDENFQERQGNRIA